MKTMMYLQDFKSTVDVNFIQGCWWLIKSNVIYMCSSSLKTAMDCTAKLDKCRNLFRSKQKVELSSSQIMSNL